MRYQDLTWRWVPSLQPASYFNWDEGEPNGWPIERFGQILEKSRQRKWNDERDSGGDYPSHALCQKKI